MSAYQCSICGTRTGRGECETCEEIKEGLKLNDAAFHKLASWVQKVAEHQNERERAWRKATGEDQ